METNGANSERDRGHGPFRTWALQHDIISLLGGTGEWSGHSGELDLGSTSQEAPEAAFRGQGYLREALATAPRLELRQRTSLALFAAALVTDIANQFSPLGIDMPTGPFWLTIALIVAALLIIGLVYPRLTAERFAPVEQSVLTFASLLIVYQCSVTGGANSPYTIWFLLTAYYAAYLLPRGRALLNLVWFTVLAVGTLLLKESHVTELVVLQLAALLGTLWAVAYALVRQRLREDTLERTITFQALADPLTSTANMRSFDQYLHELVRQDGQRFAILVADLNGLKGANAVFGHATGDGMVVRMARLMLRASSERDQVARFGGDEFAVVLPGGGAGDVTRWRKEFERETDRHNAAVRGRLPQISASIGAALYPDDGISPADLLDAADRRMYEEKAKVVTQPYEIDEAGAPHAVDRARTTRFQNVPREAIDVRDMMRQASVNWLAFGLPLIAAAAIGGPQIIAVAALACGVYSLALAATTEAFRTIRLTRTSTNVLDVLTLLLPLPATWAAGGASSPLLITMTLPVAFYGQNFKPSRAIPRIAIVLAGYSIGFWAFGTRGLVEETRFLTSIAAMLIVAVILQYSSSQQRRALATIRSSALRDRLTSLPNAFALRRDLEAALARRHETPDSPAASLIVIDLDDFRRANTIAGHRGGDEVLCSVADRLAGVAGLSPVYRIDGDEFAVIVHGLSGRALASFAQRCGRSVEYEHQFNSGTHTLRACTGHAAWFEGERSDEMIDRAEAMLQQEKSVRRGPEPSAGRLML